MGNHLMFCVFERKEYRITLNYEFDDTKLFVLL